MTPVVRTRVVVAGAAIALAACRAPSAEDGTEFRPVDPYAGTFPEWEVVHGATGFQHLELRDDAREGYGTFTGQSDVTAHDRVLHYVSNGLWADTLASRLTRAEASQFALGPDGRTGWARDPSGRLVGRLLNGNWSFTRFPTLTNPAAEVWYDLFEQKFAALVADGSPAPATPPAAAHVALFDGRTWVEQPNTTTSLPGKVRRNPADGRWWRLDSRSGVLTYYGGGREATLPGVQDFWIGAGGAARAVNSGGQLLVLHGGEWRREATLPAGGQYSLWFNRDGSKGFVYGLGGIAMELTNGRWRASAMNTLGGADLSGLWLNGALTEGWAVGLHGQVLHYFEGSWRKAPVANGDTTNWTDVALTRSGDHGWMVGFGGAIAEYDSGAWRRLTRSPTEQPISSLWLDPDGKTGLALSGDGILRLADGAWTLLSPPRRQVLAKAIILAGPPDRVWIDGPGSERFSVKPFHLGEGGELRSGVDSLNERYEVMRMWSEPGFRTWAVGVDTTSRVGEYSLLKVQGHELSPRATLQFMPRVLWMSEDGGRGVMATGNGHDSFSFVLDGDSVYARRLPVGQLSRLWLDAHAVSGWAVGDGGLIVRIVPHELPRPRLVSNGKDVAELKGSHELRFGPPPLRSKVVGVALTEGGEVVRSFHSPEHYRVEPVGDSVLKIVFTGARAYATPFEHHNVRLRVTLEYPISEPAYHVVYQTGEIPLSGHSAQWWGIRIVGGFIILNLGLVLLAIPFRRTRRIIFSETGSKFISLWVGKYVLIDFFATYVLRPSWLFLDFRRRMRAHHPAVAHWRAQTFVAPEVSLPQPPPVRTRRSPRRRKAARADNEQWKTVYRTMRESGAQGVFVVQGRSGLGKTALLENWAAFALELGDTPFLIRLGDRSAADEARTLMEQWGAFPSDAPPLFQGGGFVFLLDGLNEDLHRGETGDFVRRLVGRNLVIVASQVSPGWEGNVPVFDVNLQPFGRPQLESLLPREAVDQILANERLLEWARLPQAAILLREYWQAKKTLPEAQVELYAALVDNLDDPALVAKLEYRAWELFTSNRVRFVADESIPQSDLERARDAGILTRREEGSGIHFMFVHERVSRFLVARYLRRQPAQPLHKWNESLAAGVERQQWTLVLEFWAELIALDERDRLVGAGRYEAFLDDVKTFSVPALRILSPEAGRLEDLGFVTLSPGFFRRVADALAGPN